MIEPEEIDAFAARMGTHHANVERDYVFGWLLKAFFENDYLAPLLIFKGGNCMRKAFYPETRFSGDLDFSVQSAIDLERFQTEINRACAEAETKSGVVFDTDRNSFRADQMLDKERQSFKGRVYFEDFYGEEAEILISVRLDVTEFDRIYLPLVTRSLIHPREQDKRVKAENQLQSERFTTSAERDFIEKIKKDPKLSELVKDPAGTNDRAAVDEFWRELVEGSALAAAAKQSGLTAAELRDRIPDVKKLEAENIDVGKAARNAAVTASVDKAMGASAPGAPEQVARIVERGMSARGTGGHRWPPIITLNDAKGKFFRSGSAELDPEFRRTLSDSTARRIAELVKEYEVDVIEVVGHTDEQPVGLRQSNLDRDLIPVLTNASGIGSVVPADNAGLGLARAVSVVTVLRHSELLSGYKILPLSGGQLINTDETLAVVGTPGDIRERRRIEIRLRKSTPRDEDAAVSPAPPAPTAEPSQPVRRPPQRPQGATPLPPPPTLPPAPVQRPVYRAPEIGASQ